MDNISGAAMSQILPALRQFPGVTDAAASTTSVPPFMGGPLTPMSADAAGSTGVAAHRHVVSAGFFSAIGVPIRMGRAFADTDLPSARIAIANETLARRLFPGHDPLGRQVWVGDASYEIVGIVADYASSPLQSPATDPTLFLLLPADSQEAGRIQCVIGCTAIPPGSCRASAGNCIAWRPAAWRRSTRSIRCQRRRIPRPRDGVHAEAPAGPAI